MKTAVVLVALVSLAFAAPQPRKDFHDHFADFSDLIEELVGDQLNSLMEQYTESAEFIATLQYISTTDFRQLIFEMEDLPEFKAVTDFLDTHNVDISYFIDRFNDMLLNENRPQTRQIASGADFNSFVKDCTALFPKEELAALFDVKFAEEDDFRAAIEGLQSDEFDALFSALWESPVFMAEVQTLAENGIHVGLLLDELVAMFGQGARK